MSLDLFRLIGGINIEEDNGLNSANILRGIGLPGGDASVEDASPIGSIYMRNDVEADNLQLYYKYTTANNSSDDWKVVTDKAYVDAVANGISWREPVEVLDSTTTTIPTGTATQPITVDGISITDGQRVLFTAITTPTDRNVWIYDQASGTFSEDPNAETDGDALLVRQGTSAEQQWVYDGTDWVQFGSVSGYEELQWIRNFIGKAATGNVLPVYTSQNVVTNGDDLEAAIGKLDATAGDGVITNDTTDNAATNYALSDDMSWDGAGGTLTLTGALNELNNAIGDRTYTEDNVVVDGQTAAESIDALDIAVGNLNTQFLEIAGTNVVASAGTTLDTLPLTDATEAKWMVQIRENGTPANRRALEVHAMNDGATLVDHTEYAVLKLGANIVGFNIDVDISGTDMRLRVTATNNIDFVVKRISYSAF